MFLAALLSSFVSVALCAEPEDDGISVAPLRIEQVTPDPDYTFRLLLQTIQAQDEQRRRLAVAGWVVMASSMVSFGMSLQQIHDSPKTGVPQEAVLLLMASGLQMGVGWWMTTAPVVERWPRPGNR